mmetsp:Transcript_142941/g.398289  ORF Transcript_142941/g.398289 Transcript_142941/m.398289 type:complete len:200 (+) Transcript_142941:189-788(+)
MVLQLRLFQARILLLDGVDIHPLKLCVRHLGGLGGPAHIEGCQCGINTGGLDLVNLAILVFLKLGLLDCLRCRLRFCHRQQCLPTRDLSLGHLGRRLFVGTAQLGHCFVLSCLELFAFLLRLKLRISLVLLGCCTCSLSLGTFVAILPRSVLCRLRCGRGSRGALCGLLVLRACVTKAHGASADEGAQWWALRLRRWRR